MQLKHSVYRRMFQRYLRTGTGIELQLKAATETMGQKLLRKAHDASTMGRRLVEGRIGQLRTQFDKNGRHFPDKVVPDTQMLEDAFEQQHRTLLDSFGKHAENAFDPDWNQKLAAAEGALNDRFGQLLDPILQPHYGIKQFIWTGDSANPCANCAAHIGNIYDWSDGDYPPGCIHCRCTAQPYLGPDAQGVEPVYPIEGALAAGLAFALGSATVTGLIADLRTA